MVSRYDHSACLPTAGAPTRTARIPVSTCTLCGAVFSCAMADNTPGACWCTTLPAAVPLPEEAGGCWCRPCLESRIAQLSRATPPTELAKNPEPNNEGQCLTLIVG
ncbi:cysteine-rich CWC family protein [Massilia sp. S19_KUP03_FR1]|uniref:cysteine-rich CWC family protein n=1 Tax=Massilia sp. S19_KUP03_FR1 TaxID=3025503 RepID=UPI002FCD882E